MYFLQERHTLNIQEYFSRYFRPHARTKIYGEIDPHYLAFQEIPAKLYALLGKDITFVCLLRNPVDRAYSHYWMSVRRGREQYSFEQAFLSEKERLRTEGKLAALRVSYFDQGFYASRIENYLRYFPLENFIFFTFEEFIAKRERMLKKVLHFLGVEPNFRFQNVQEHALKGGVPQYMWISRLQAQPSIIKQIWRRLIPNFDVRWKICMWIEKMNTSSKRPPAMDANTRQMLQHYYQKDMRKLELLIHKDLSQWYG